MLHLNANIDIEELSKSINYTFAVKMASGYVNKYTFIIWTAELFWIHNVGHLAFDVYNLVQGLIRDL